MVADDIDQVAALEQLLFPDGWSLWAIRKEFEKPYTHCWDAKTGEKIIGYIFFSIVADELELADIGIAPAFQKQGIASALLSQMLIIGKKAGARLALLEVRTTNYAAIALYEKFGFKTINIRKKYYQHDLSDAFIMSLTIV